MVEAPRRKRTGNLDCKEWCQIYIRSLTPPRAAGNGSTCQFSGSRRETVNMTMTRYRTPQCYMEAARLAQGQTNTERVKSRPDIPCSIRGLC